MSILWRGTAPRCRPDRGRKATRLLREAVPKVGAIVAPAHRSELGKTRIRSSRLTASCPASGPCEARHGQRSCDRGRAIEGRRAGCRGATAATRDAARRLMHRSRVDLTDQRFGRLLVASYAFTRNRTPYWLCACTCGTWRAIAGRALRRGSTKSCGCYRRDVTRALHAARRDERGKGE